MHKQFFITMNRNLGHRPCDLFFIFLGMEYKFCIRATSSLPLSPLTQYRRGQQLQPPPLKYLIVRCKSLLDLESEAQSLFFQNGPSMMYFKSPPPSLHFLFLYSAVKYSQTSFWILLIVFLLFLFWITEHPSSVEIQKRNWKTV